jgi:hypothetical protein
MNPLFRNSENPSGRPGAERAAPRAVLPAAPPPDFDAPGLDSALSAMMGHLTPYLPPPGGGLPPPGVSTVRVKTRPLGLGNRRGNERVGGFAILSLKGGRIDATVRFQVWAAHPAGADTLLTDLQGRVMADKAALWGAGFLKISQAETGVAEHVPGVGWRKSTDFDLLYEYRYKDIDGAESIIARIPIHADPEEKFSPFRETTTVRDTMIRWDNLGAAEWVPAAGVPHPVQVMGLAILAYLPAGWSGGAVTVSRTEEANPGPPTLYGDWSAFSTAVTDPSHPDRHAQMTFPTVADCLAVFMPAGGPLPMGDWDENGLRDEYIPGALVFDPPIRLEPGERFSFSYADPQFDGPAVVYLRAGLRPG